MLLLQSLSFYTYIIAFAALSQAADECPSSIWIQFKSNCYVLLPVMLKNAYSVDKARELCKVSGADIISISTEEENRFIMETLKGKWQGSEDILLGIFFDTDDDTFKWYDNSKLTFTNWIDDDNSEALLNTCAAMHASSGEWRKMNCEAFSEMETLCKTTAYSYRKKNLEDQKVLIMTLVITIAIILAITSTVLWFLYKRHSVASGLLSAQYQTSAHVTPYSDETLLVDAEEKEFAA
ncbi:CD302 antigen isoform X2 [Rhinatrema bivittatum]|uniref:CD302 antigen isoform X2 n=1 Tax=Rhinatrema bivittatum TaxID=194408 RepID=UPI00112E7DEE|nr:CD302 antigen isoform X2 [Rhinatrema bivittatum]